VKNPADVARVQQKVMVTVLEVDLARRRISLSMKSQPGLTASDQKEASEKPSQPRSPQKKKKPETSRKPAFTNPLAEALIKSGLK
jgi:uncharacterized protein